MTLLDNYHYVKASNKQTKASRVHISRTRDAFKHNTLCSQENWGKTSLDDPKKLCKICLRMAKKRGLIDET